MIGEILEFARLLHRKTWTREQIDQLRRARLRRLIDHAYHKVPYYRNLMDHAGVQPGDIREPSDLRKIPLTTKQDLRDAAEDCFAAGRGPLTALHTSGSSGTPFFVHLTSAELQTRRLREFRMLIGTGIRPRDRLTLLGSSRTRARRLHHRLGFYGIEVIPLSLPDDEQLRRFKLSKPDVVWVFPTVLQTMLYRAGCGLRDLAQPRFLITSSEMMSPLFRRQLHDELPEMPIVNIYGSTEAGRIAAECKARRGLHLEDDAVIVELLEHHQAVEPGHEGTVVVTCLDQLAMPLIRYVQGDICRLRDQPCGCGWQTPVMDPPLGRETEMITLADGAKITSARLEASLHDESDLLQYSFVQEEIGRIRASLCFPSIPPPARLTRLKRHMEQAVGENITIEIELLPEVKFEKSKFKVFTSRLNG